MKIKWDEVGKRLYETGVDHGVLFPMGEDNAYDKGVPWYGLSAVNESPSGGEPNPVWADNIKYLNLMSAEDFGATIEAYTYPDEFEACNGCAEIAPGVTIAQQDRKMFGFCYRTLIGNDTVGTNYGYKLHLVYGAQASPSEKNNQTVNDSPEAATMSWGSAPRLWMFPISSRPRIWSSTPPRPTRPSSRSLRRCCMAPMATRPPNPRFRCPRRSSSC